MHETFKAIIKFAIEAATEQVALGETDSEYGMGLWQSFQAAFPKEGFKGNYDLACTVFNTVYVETFKAALALKQGNTR